MDVNNYYGTKHRDGAQASRCTLMIEAWTPFFTSENANPEWLRTKRPLFEVHAQTGILLATQSKV